MVNWGIQIFCFCMNKKNSRESTFRYNSFANFLVNQISQVSDLKASNTLKINLVVMLGEMINGFVLKKRATLFSANKK